MEENQQNSGFDVPDDDDIGYREAVRAALTFSGNKATQLDSESYLLEALSYNRQDEFRRKLIHDLAKIYFMKGNLSEAIKLLVVLQQAYPSKMVYLQHLADAIFWSGDIDTASNLYKKMISVHYLSAKVNAERRNEPITQIIGAHDVIGRYFGEMAAKIDLYVKARVLGMTPAVEVILPAPEEAVVNKCLMDYWKNSVSDHVRIVSDRDQIRHYCEKHEFDNIPLDYYEMPDGRAYERAIAYVLIQRQWEEGGRPPLLRISSSHDEAGRQRLREFGVPRDAWFICLHVREASYFKETDSGSQNSNRNANIEDYLPAIEAVTARGGWVIRIGDPSMTPFPPMDNVVDYANHPLRDDWMDIFLIGSCRFFVGTTSGPSAVATVFGVPKLVTNFFPLGFWPYSGKDIFIHKLLRSREDSRFLAIDEAFRPPLIGVHFSGFFEDQGIEVLDNSPDDILDAVTEMLDVVEGKQSYSEEDEEHQRKYKSLTDFFGAGVSSRVGCAFLRKHPFLIGA
jgi:putative glycosyltransferase (TIGR04372 family)